MKRRCASALTWVSGIAIAWSVQGQNGFQDLDFESASLVPTGGGVEFAPAFPGWMANVGGVPLDNALYDNVFLDSSGVSIIDSNFSFRSVSQGNYTAILQAGDRLGTFQPADTTLTQIGLVPSGTRSLLFEAQFTYGRPPTSFIVTLGGQSLSLVALSTSGAYTLLGADVEQWAGQEAELAFTVFAGRPHIDNAYLALDAIQFSNEEIPEPGAFGLFILGAGLLHCRVVSNSRRLRKS